MKKLINEPADAVDEMLDGMVAAHDGVQRLDGTEVVVRADAPVDGKVGIVSGGGSGHEPTHGGYVGEGMLDGAAAGEIFTSPTADQLQEMVTACDGSEGVLCVVKNYEGDVMNFDTAAEMAEMEDTEVDRSSSTMTLRSRTRCTRPVDAASAGRFSSTKPPGRKRPRAPTSRRSSGSPRRWSTTSARWGPH